MKRTGWRRVRGLAAALAAGAIGAPAAALVLEFPAAATTTGTLAEPLASAPIPAGAWDGAQVPLTAAEGRVERTAWRIDAPGLPTLALMQPLRAQLQAAGFELGFECETRACGGFDFRYALDLLPEPEMHVDLGDFRYLTARRGEEVVGLMVSRSASAGFVQLTRVTPAEIVAPAPMLAAAVGAPLRVAGGGGELALPDQPGTTVSLSAANAMPSELALRLAETGGAVLDDLVFASGASRLEPGDYPSLAALADWLRADPARQVTLVGHTDAAGGLEGNIVLSRRRAEAVRAALVGEFGVAPGQVRAEGVGFLSPRASNETEDGRRLNRRVEAVVVAGG